MRRGPLRSRPGSAAVLPVLATLCLLAASAAPAQDEPVEPPAEAEAPEEPPLEVLEIESPPLPSPALLLPVNAAGSLLLEVGTGRLVTLPSEVERVALADEAVARVQVISSREVLLSGLAVGRTNLFVWLRDGGRLSYRVRVERDVELLRRALRDLDPDIALRASEDGSSILLVGDVDDAATADAAVVLARQLLDAQGGQGRPAEVLSFLRHPPSTEVQDLWLTEALHAIDPRIRVRRIQVGDGPQPELDSYILEGRVRTVEHLMKAVILAERQLGGTGVRVEAPVRDLTSQRNQGFTGTAGVEGLASLSRPPSGLAAQVARGLVITSDSGRVMSLLEVDELPQIMVSIRAYQIDRAKARQVGIDWRFDSEHLSLGSFTGPQGQGLPGFFGGAPDVGQILGGNLAGAFVDGTFALAAAIDFLEEKELARAVAEPNIVTLSGEEATILIGGEVPIPTTTVGQVTAVQGFLFQSFGVQLNLRPTLDGAGVVTLEASPSIIRPSPGLGVGGVPGFQVQSVQTTARVPAGQSLVLGGLLTFDEGLEEARVPVLGRLPFFRWTRRSHSEQELLFIITPRVVQPPEPPLPPVRLPPGDHIRLPELEVPEEPDGWRDPWEVEADPPALPATGVPRDLLRPPAPPAGPEETPWPPGPELPVEMAPSERGEPADRAGEYLLPEEPAPPEDVPGAPPDWRQPGAVLVVSDAAEPCLNLRPQPSFLVDPADCLYPGSLVELLGHLEGWDEVAAPDGRVGWVRTEYLEPAEDPR